MFKVKKLNVETMRTVDAYPQQFETAESARKYMESELQKYAEMHHADILKVIGGSILLTFKKKDGTEIKQSFFVTA